METEALRNGAALSAAAMTEWQQHVDHVLRGIAHSLNNRTAAVSAVLELAGDDAAEDVRDTLGILRTEVARFGELSAAVRAIGAPRRGAEAFPVADAAADAVTALRLHSGLREREIEIDASEAPPVRVPRWMFVHALIALGASLPENAKGRIALNGEGDWVVARLTSGEAARGAATPCVQELAGLMGGDALKEGVGFRVPTLAAIRRREAV
jgi:hypothetical protein